MWKRWLILLAIICAIIVAFVALEGIVLIIVLMVLFPLAFFYTPLLFGFDKKEEETEEAKKEREGKFHKWE